MEAQSPFESITPEKAQQIVHVSSMFDLPIINYVCMDATLQSLANKYSTKQYSLPFALSKAYAIVRLSPRLLVG
jgi:hypothetical protein